MKFKFSYPMCNYNISDKPDYGLCKLTFQQTNQKCVLF